MHIEPPEGYDPQTEADPSVPFDSVPDDEPEHDPMKVFRALAAEHGLVRPGDKIDQNIFDFAASIVSLCASIGDQYPDVRNDGSAGDHIRAIYCPA